MRYIDADKLAKTYMMKGKDKLRIATVINELELAPTGEVVTMIEFEAWQRKYELAVAEREANVKAFTEELDKRKVMIRLLERDIADRDKMLEAKVEEVYADFMRDYKCMREELDGLYDEYAELKRKSTNEPDILKSTITHKEEQAYNKGYEDAKADILGKIQTDIARDKILAEYGDDFFEGRIAGFKAVVNYITEETK